MMAGNSWSWLIPSARVHKFEYWDTKLQVLTQPLLDLSLFRTVSHTQTQLIYYSHHPTSQSMRTYLLNLEIPNLISPEETLLWFDELSKKIIRPLRDHRVNSINRFFSRNNHAKSLQPKYPFPLNACPDLNLHTVCQPLCTPHSKTNPVSPPKKTINKSPIWKLPFLFRVKRGFEKHALNTGLFVLFFIVGGFSSSFFWRFGVI